MLKMTKFKHWIQLCVVIVTLLICLGEAKDAIGCYHDNTCMLGSPTCVDKSLIILNDIKWYVKPSCTSGEGTCASCCFFSNKDENATLSSSHSVEIYSRCQRQSSCDPYTDLQPPAGFENGYLRVSYTCEQETSSGADDTGQIPVYVIYATIFPVIGLSVILVLICSYRWFVNKRQGAVCPKTSKSDGNEQMANDIHASDKETKSIDEMFTASQTSLLRTKTSEAAVDCIPKVQDCNNTDIPSGVENLNAVLDNVTQAKESSEPDESNFNVMDETVENNGSFVSSKNASHKTKESFALNKGAKHPDSDQETSGPKIMYTYGVTQNNTNPHKSSSLPGHKTGRNDRTKNRNRTGRRNVRNSRKQQKQLIRNMKLMKNRMHNERKLRHCVSSSDEYSPISTSCSESSFDTNGDESNLGQSLEYNTNDLVAIEQSCLKTDTNYNTKPINRSQMENHEPMIKKNEAVAQYRHNDVNDVKEPISSEFSNKQLDKRFVDSLGQRASDINEITSNEGVSLHSNTKVTEENYSSTNVTIRNKKSETEGFDTKNLNQQTQNDHSNILSNVSKEGPIATSSFRNVREEEARDLETFEDYEKAKNSNKLGNETSIPAWCIPKPPDTPDLQYKTKQSEDAQNETLDTHKSSKRRNEVIYKRRKRKYESMREAKRETIFGILQKLEAVPKKSILKKSKSMLVTKHECKTNHHEDENRKTITFADDSNLTDLDKIHKLTEPCGQYTSEFETKSKHSNGVKNTHGNKKSSDMLPARKSEHCNATLYEETLFANNKTVLEKPRITDAHFRGIISSNLKQKSLSAEMNDKVHHADLKAEKVNCIDAIEESSQDSYHSQQQMNIRDKLIRARKHENDVSDEDALCLPDAYMNEWFNDVNNFNQDLDRDSLCFRDNINIIGTDNELKQSDLDIVDNVTGTEMLIRPLKGLGNSRHLNGHTDTKVKQDLFTGSDVVGQDTYHNDFDSDEYTDISESPEDETDLDITMDPGNHSVEENKLSNNEYCAHSMTNIDRNSTENSPIPETNNKYFHPNISSPNFSRFPGYSVEHPKLSGSSHSLDQSSASHINSHVKDEPNFRRFPGYSVEHPKLSGSSHSIDQSSASQIHSHVKDESNFRRFPGFSVEHPKLSGSSHSLDRSSVSQIHSHVKDERHIDQIRERPKSALGGRSGSAMRDEPPWIHGTPKLQSSKTYMDLQSFMNLGEGQSHDPKIIPKQAVAPRDSIAKKLSTKSSVGRNTAPSASLNTQQEQKAIRQDESKLKHVNLKQTSDPHAPKPSNRSPNFENKAKYGGSRNKMNKKTTGYLQNFITEFNSRVYHSSRKPHLPSSPFDLQGRTAETFDPILRSKTPMPSTLSREDQVDKVSLARNLSLRSERITLDPSFSRNKAAKLSGKTDTQLELRELEMIKSKDREAKKLLNRRLKEKNKVYDSHDFKEPTRERPRSAMSGRYGSRAGSRSTINRNKSISNGSTEHETSNHDTGRNSSMSQSGNRDFYLTEAASRTQCSVAGWSRWNHRSGNTRERRSQPTYTADVQLEEYDSELENFFANPDAEVLHISNGSSQDRQALSRSKSCIV